CQVELQAEDRKEAQRDDDVVQQCGDRTGRELPLEAEHDVDEDHAQRENHRGGSLFSKVLSNLRADELHPTQLNARVIGSEDVAQRLPYRVRIEVRLWRQPQHHVRGGAEPLYLDVVVPGFRHQLAYPVEIGFFRVAYLQQ